MAEQNHQRVKSGSTEGGTAKQGEQRRPVAVVETQPYHIHAKWALLDEADAVVVVVGGQPRFCKETKPAGKQQEQAAWPYGKHGACHEK